jgi:hypothetical protein
MKKLTCDEFINLIGGKIIGVEPHTGAAIRVSPNRAVAWFNETVDAGAVGYVGQCVGYVFLGVKKDDWNEAYQVGGRQ